jgi:glycosyltransferase involved in cell wall biosynthesis
MTKKILWLCSWYPNPDRPFDGDFIQRHAKAVSAFTPLDILYVHKTTNHALTDIHTENERLHEHILINRIKKHHRISAIISWIRFFQIHQQFLRKYGKPDLVHVHIPIKSGMIALWWKLRYGIPYMVTEHYGIYNPHLDDHFKTRAWWFRLATKWIIKHADRLTTVSHSLGEDINQWVVQKSYSVVPNVVDTNVFTYQKPKDTNPFQFIHISNMIPLKNVSGILTASAQLVQMGYTFRLILLGHIDQAYPLMAEQMGLLDKVVFFEGEVSYELVAQRIRESHALLIFSDTESQSCVTLEALCSGRPAIVTNIGGVKELIATENGFKVNVRDTADLCTRMQQMITHYNQFDTEAISRQAASKFAYPIVGKQFTDLYDEVLG